MTKKQLTEYLVKTEQERREKNDCGMTVATLVQELLESALKQKHVQAHPRTMQRIDLAMNLLLWETLDADHLMDLIASSRALLEATP